MKGIAITQFVTAAVLTLVAALAASSSLIKVPIPGTWAVPAIMLAGVSLITGIVILGMERRARERESRQKVRDILHGGNK